MTFSLSRLLTVAPTKPTQEQRLEELHRHPAPPPGLEVHKEGLRHEVQPGDSAWALARDYSQAYHMDISARDIIQSNPAAFALMLFPGKNITIPGLEQRFDAMIMAEKAQTKPITHTVKANDTLYSLARDYRTKTIDGQLTWRQIYDHNRSVIGANPNLIRVGQVITIPNTGRGGHEVSPKKSIDELSQALLLTRVGRVQHEQGGIEQIDIVRYTADTSRKQKFNSITDAIKSAKTALAGPASSSNPMAIVQTKDGAFYTVAVNGAEVSDNLDDSDRTLSTAFRAGQREVVAVVEKTFDNSVKVRRFDQ